MLRHAKSSWKYDVSDHERPLKGRGRKDAKLVSDHVKDLVDPPQKIVCSGAVRAQSTAKYFKKAWKISDEDFITENELYDFSGQQVMSVIKELDNDLRDYHRPNFRALFYEEKSSFLFQPLHYFLFCPFFPVQWPKS